MRLQFARSTSLPTIGWRSYGHDTQVPKYGITGLGSTPLSGLLQTKSIVSLRCHPQGCLSSRRRMAGHVCQPNSMRLANATPVGGHSSETLPYTADNARPTFAAMTSAVVTSPNCRIWAQERRRLAGAVIACHSYKATLCANQNQNLNSQKLYTCYGSIKL
jgi:hypothetical protein